MLGMNLWGQTDICQRFGVTREAVRKWRRTEGNDFPEPIAFINDGATPVWDADAVKEWRKAFRRRRDAQRKATLERKQRSDEQKRRAREAKRNRKARAKGRTPAEQRAVTQAAREALGISDAPGVAKPTPTKPKDFAALVDDTLSR